jgi:hypothetical protein
MLEELRTGWREGARAWVTYQPTNAAQHPRLLSGSIDRVATSGAYIVLRGVHVPTDAIVSWQVECAEEA